MANGITPVRFTPQFDPIVHQGYVSQLQRMQQQYDDAYKAQLMAEDAFSQLPTATEDIAGKQMLLGQFQDKVQSLVDKAGGDYGAVSKQIAREVTNLRKNPFVQMASQKAKLAEEERMMRAKLGINAIPVQSVLGKPILDSEGNLQVSPEDLRYSVLDQRDVLQRALQEYSPLAQQRREQAMKQIKPGLLQQDTIFGLTESEARDKTPEITQYLLSQYPELAQAAESGQFNLEGLSANIANQLVRGSTSQVVRDPSFSASGSGFNIPKAVAYDAELLNLDKEGKTAGELAKEANRARNAIGSSPVGLIGTSESRAKIKDPIVRAIDAQIMRNNPELAAKMDLPLSNEVNARLSKLTGADAVGILNEAINQADVAYVESKAGYDQYRKSKKENYAWLNPLNTISYYLSYGDELVRGNYGKILKDRIEEQIKNANPNLSAANVSMATNHIFDEYVSRSESLSKEYESKLEEIVKKDTGDDIFKFSTVNFASKEGKQALDILKSAGETTVVPEKIKFLTGDYKDMSAEKLAKKYNNNKTRPSIVAVGGDENSGNLFKIKNPDGTTDIATLDVDPESRAVINQAFGRIDLISQDFYHGLNLQDDQNLIGDFKYRQMPGGGHAAYISDEDSESFITNSDMVRINKLLQDSGLNPIPVEGNQEDIFVFPTKKSLLLTLKFLNK